MASFARDATCGLLSGTARERSKQGFKFKEAKTSKEKLQPETPKLSASL